jgi:hypothetical protein
MKLVRVLSRIALISLAAAVFVGLTGIYGGSRRLGLPSASWQEERGHRLPAPQVDYFPDVIGDGIVLAIFAFAGRIIFRLRLSPVSRNEGQLNGGIRHLSLIIRHSSLAGSEERLPLPQMKNDE